jgi:membrane associated rhomboid family serine protease
VIQVMRPRTPSAAEPRLDPHGWLRALLVAGGLAAALWLVQLANAVDHERFDRFGVVPRQVDGLWGVLTAVVLNHGYAQLLANTLPLLALGWAVLLGGIRIWAFVSVFVVVGSGLLTWLAGPSGATVVGAGGLVFGWLGYLIGRAVFSRRLRWLLLTAIVLMLFGSLLGGLVPTLHAREPWQLHLGGFLAGLLVSAVLHRRSRQPRRPSPPADTSKSPTPERPAPGPDRPRPRPAVR